jgi:hypothetical protein
MIKTDATAAELKAVAAYIEANQAEQSPSLSA